MSNGRRFRRSGRAVFVADVGGGHDCPVCRALGQHVEADGSITQLEGVEPDQAEALRLILLYGEDW